MKIFVVNLKRRPDRLEQFYKRCPFEKSIIEIVYGFDGKNPDKEKEKERSLFNDKFSKLKLNGGVKGCFISHMRIWKKIVDQNIPYAIVFEDDAQFNVNFMNIYNNMTLPENFNIIYLGGRFNDNFTMSDETIKEKINGNGVNLITHNFKTDNNMYHERTTHAYIISNKLARFYLDLINISYPTIEVDKFMVDVLKKLDLPMHSINPLVCWSPMISDSDIR